MTILTWDQTGERIYETGTSKGVLHVKNDLGVNGDGVAWNGLVSVKQAPDGAEATDLFADNQKYVSMRSAENFKGSIDAFTWPEEFNACDGVVEVVAGAYVGQQTRYPFDLTYETLLGNDTKDLDYGRKIHFIWGAKVSPSNKDYETVNNDPNALTFSWEFETTPVPIDKLVNGKKLKPTSYMVVDSTTLTAAQLTKIEEMIYGTEKTQPKMPTPTELITLLITPAA